MDSTLLPANKRGAVALLSGTGSGGLRQPCGNGELRTFETRTPMQPLLRSLCALALALLMGAAFATHNEAGEILLCNVGGTEYEVTIITHTNPDSPADRPDFILQWGDGFTDTIPRLSDDVIIVAGISVQRNVYVSRHIYPGPGSYILQYEDPNRVANVINIDGGASVDVPMCVQSMIIVVPGRSDCLPIFTNPPIQNACLGECWEHNPGAYDLDGDSLSYEPRVCLGFDCEPVPNYRFPDEVGPGPNNQYDIDPVTGTITWCAPQQQGIYNIAFAVVEWRNFDGTWFPIGWVMRDMQVIVGVCDNRPPVIVELLDTCVEAGTTLNFTVNATDPDPGQVISLFGIGGPFEEASSPATFSSAPGPSPVSGSFQWATNCTHVQQQPYLAIFKAQDNWQPVQLVDYASMFITVVAPAPQNPTATPDGSIMRLAWEPDVCTNATGYRIYRRQGLFGFDPDDCETGVPGYTGYQFIGSTSGWSATTYNDLGLSFGITYCYMVVAVFGDGAESYASVEFCAMLERDVPIMTNVTVVTTNITAGADSIRWSNAYDLDTNQFPGPYVFRLFEGTGYDQATTLVYTSLPHPFLAHPDTVFFHSNINTAGTAHVYRVELFGSNGDSLIGSSNTASSVFLELVPNDEQITLNMLHSSPWINTLFEVYRETTPDVFTLIATSTTPTYVDTALVNGQDYCYKVRSIGAYNDPGIVSPLLNWSQETCAAPVDLTPPCPPTLALDNDCEVPLNTLTWNNPNESCADDTYQYNLWFTDSLGGQLDVIATITGAELTTYFHTDGQSVAGCYAVSAIDSVGNESALSDTVCGDNCPIYTLPNVFSPNNDRTNDFFVPFPYRGVKEIDLHIFNRWGQLVFTSTDPDITWPGTLKQTSEPVPDGVYYYTCAVVLKRLAGDETLLLKGYVHILRGANTPLN